MSQISTLFTLRNNIFVVIFDKKHSFFISKPSSPILDSWKCQAFLWIAHCNGGILRSHLVEPSIGQHTGLALSHTDGRRAEGISHGMIKTAWHAGGNGTERRGGRAEEELITVLMSYFIIVFLNATELSFARPFPPHTYSMSHSGTDATLHMPPVWILH